ncbi:MAG TPA: recombinase family protein [Sedimentisphaerales bacterium]|nr:recombinase family protein [Sedimentisphaerales bacterium]
MIRQNSNTRQDSRAVGYVRRSTDRQEQSIPDQKKALEAYAAEHGLHLVKFYIDDAISGTSTLGRRAFQQMIGDAESPTRRFDIIVVYDVKRFGRIDNDEAGYYRYKLRTHGVEVRYVSENFNGDTTDDLLRPVKQWQARQESRDLSKVTIRGLLSKSDTGFWMGGTPPYGYDLRYENGDGKFLFILRYMPDGSKQLLDKKGTLVRTLARGESLSISKRDHARLVPSDHERVKIIKRLFKMYAEQGKGYRSLADTLNQEGVPTPRGPEWSHIYTGLWTDSTIRSILVNPIYAGDMVWNRRTDARFHRISKGQAVDRESVHGVRLVPNQKEDWIFVRDAHPPLISRRLFEQAKQRLESHPKSIEQRQRISKLNTHGKTWNGQRSRFILSGLMKCSLCGYRYQGVTRVKGKKRLDGTQVKTRYYGCGGYITKGKKVCQMNSIPQKILEGRVIDAVLDFYRPYLNKGGHRKLAEAVKKQIGSEGKEFAAARQRAQAEQEKIGKIINNLLDNITSTNREYVDRRLNELKQQRLQLEARLEELDQLSLSQAEIDNIVTDSMQFLSGLEFTLRQGLPQEKLVALRQCIERIWIDKPAGSIKLAIRLVPAGNLQATQEFKTSV